MASKNSSNMDAKGSDNITALINEVLEKTSNDVMGDFYGVPTNDQNPHSFVFDLTGDKDQVLAWNPGNKDALERAISARRMMLDVLIREPNIRPIFGSLAVMCLLLYGITRDIKDLEEAVEFGNQVEYWITDDEESFEDLVNLATLYFQRFDVTKTAEDLDQAIRFAERSFNAMKQASEQDAKEASACYVLAILRYQRFLLTDSLEDLKEVLLKAAIAMAGIPPNRPDWFSTVRSLVMRLLPTSTRYGGDSATYLEVLRDVTRVDPEIEDFVTSGFRKLERSELRTVLNREAPESPGKVLTGDDEEHFTPEKRLDLVGPDNRVQVRQLPALMIFAPGAEGEQYVDSIPISQPGQMETFMHAVAGPPGSVIGENDDEEREIVELEDRWRHDVDNVFANGFFHRLGQLGVPHGLSNVSKLCSRCSETLSSLLSNEMELVSVFTNPGDFSAEGCALCDRLRQSSNLPEPLRMLREGSNLKIEGQNAPRLRLYADPSLGSIPQDIQVFSPIYGNPGYNGYYELLREWVQDCDKHHQCLHSARCEGHTSSSAPDSELERLSRCTFGEDELLPTRVIDVSLGKDADLLSLHESKRGERAKYITLSHCWGNLDQEVKNKYCTYRCNWESRCKGIAMKDLPQTFQDAVTVTRELGIRFLWIDSMCIIQPHKGCSKRGCAEQYDWTLEGQKMERYYGRSYCTLAASSATDSTQGFLHNRSPCIDVKIKLDSIGHISISEAVDDFKNDVEEAPLNKRGWVLQERALSRRIIHFTKRQTYWECGDGIRCETMTKLHNPRAGFLGDSHFSQKIQAYTKSNRIRLLQLLFETYTRLDLSYNADRRIAIAGLLERLGGDQNAEVHYGILDRYLHRCLLWRRSTSSKTWERIRYGVSAQVPSWSWMAYVGEITYEKVPFYKVDWNTNVFPPSGKDLFKEEVPNHAREVGLKACVRAFSPTAEELSEAQKMSWDARDRGALVFDGNKSVDIRELKCVIIGRMRGNERSDEQKHFILVVETEEVEHTYKRVGIGSVQKRDISFDEAESAWII